MDRAALGTGTGTFYEVMLFNCALRVRWDLGVVGCLVLVGLSMMNSCIWQLQIASRYCTFMTHHSLSHTQTGTVLFHVPPNFIMPTSFVSLIVCLSSSRVWQQPR